MLIGNISVYYVKLKPSIAFLIFHTLFCFQLQILYNSNSIYSHCLINYMDMYLVVWLLLGSHLVLISCKICHQRNERNITTRLQLREIIQGFDSSKVSGSLYLVQLSPLYLPCYYHNIYILLSFSWLHQDPVNRS
jgi:hypothetical protein